MELCLMFCASLDGRGVWGRMDTCICTAESLHWSPETTTTLLTGYTPIQNKKLKRKKGKREMICILVVGLRLKELRSGEVLCE